MSPTAKVLTVYHAGPVCVVGFGNHEVHPNLNLAQCRDEIVELVQQTQCHTLAFDLTSIKFLPSGLLGLISSSRKLNVEVHLYNPSDDVQDVLKVTKLNEVLHIHQLEVNS